MFVEKNEDTTGFIEDSHMENQNNHIPEDTREASSVSYNILFKNDDDLMIKESQSDKEPRISFFGIFSDSKFSAIINLTTSAIGAGCLNFPIILISIGLPLTIIIFLFVSICEYYSVDLLRSFVVDTKFFSFALMTNEILGKNWLVIYVICSLAFYLSVEINYLSIIYTIISKTIGFSGKNEIFINIIYFVTTILIEIFICSYISKIRKIHLFSLISSLFFIIILLIIVIQGSINFNDKLDHDFINPSVTNKEEYILELMSFIIEFLYGFCYHSSYPTLLSNLKHVDDESTKTVNIISFIFISISYLLITFFGFFLKVPMSEILFIKNTSSKHNSTFIIIFRIIICLFLFSVVPLRFVVLRDNYSSLINRYKKIDFIPDLIAVSISLLFCNLVVYLTNESIISFNIALNFIQIFGGVFGVIISFVLPVINYIGANGKRKIKSIFGIILSVIFIIIGILSVIYSIYGLKIRNEYDNEK